MADAALLSLLPGQWRLRERERPPKGFHCQRSKKMGKHIHLQMGSKIGTQGLPPSPAPDSLVLPKTQAPKGVQLLG